jgi:hypothetical protein
MGTLGSPQAGTFRLTARASTVARHMILIISLFYL